MLELTVCGEAMLQSGGACSRVPHDKLDHWLQVAAPVPGRTGFAIGRSIWQDALHAHLHHYSTARETRRRITSAYLDYAGYYLAARDGVLTDKPDPEFW